MNYIRYDFIIIQKAPMQVYEQQESEVALTPEQEYEIWKQNSPLMYDRLIVQKLPQPSLTICWLADKHESKNSVTYKYVYSTNSCGEEETEFVHFAQMEFRRFSMLEDETENEVPENQICWSVEHPGEANRVIRHPSNPKQIATKTAFGPINIYQDGVQGVVHTLEAHQSEGYGIDWKEHGIASGGYDGLIAIWKDPYSTSGPTSAYRHTDKVEDVRWFGPNVVLAVADDGKAIVWDVRASKVQAEYFWCKNQIYSIDMNPYQPELIVAGTHSGTIQLRDFRKLDEALYPFSSGHSQEVIRVQWSPHSPNVFASASTDTLVNVWDLLKVGVDVPTCETLEKPNELIFTHKGHQAAVSDLNWNLYQPLLGSVEEEHDTLQFYQIPSFLNEKISADDQFQRKQIFC